MKKYNYNINLLPQIATVTGMTSLNERRFLYQYGLKDYNDCGRIVDLGCWLGATTIALANGVSENSKIDKNEKKIFAYDLFAWDNSYDIHVKDTKLKNIFKLGDNFIEEFKLNTKLFDSFIEVRTDIVKIGWHGELIEFLLVDAMKTPTVTRAILDEFYPFLIPGKSFVYHQDFDHYLTPWVHILIYLHRNYLKHFHDIPGSGGTVFLLKKKIPNEILNLDFLQVEENTVDEAFKYCLSIAAKTKHHGIAGAHVMYYILQKKFDKAFYTWTKYLWEGFNLNDDFVEVKKLMDKSRS